MLRNVPEGRRSQTHISLILGMFLLTAQNFNMSGRFIFLCIKLELNATFYISFFPNVPPTKQRVIVKRKLIFGEYCKVCVENVIWFHFGPT